MPPDIPSRRKADSVLPLILQRLDRQDQLSDDRYRETKERQDERHRENLARFDAMAGVKPIVDRHEQWIESEGKPAVKRGDEVARIVSNTQAGVSGGVKGFKLGLMMGGSGAAGAGLVKVLGLIAAAIPH